MNQAVHSAKTISIDHILGARVVSRGRDQHLANSITASPYRDGGYVMEFGVRDGRSIALISEEVGMMFEVWGFDSFVGFPEAWHKGPNSVRPEGENALPDGKPPQVADNVTLVKGWFKDTLPIWLDEFPGPIAFMHLDADLYSSTYEVLQILNQSIVKGTVIVFDEIYDFMLGGKNFQYWDRCEYKALTTWMAESDREIEIRARSEHAQASVIVTK